MIAAREEFARALAASAPQRQADQFATRDWMSPDGLSLEIKGVGPVEMPIGDAVAEGIRKVARPAPFGWRDQTLHDQSVRHTWEVPKSRVKLPLRAWKGALAAPLDRIREKLGLPDGCALVPTLDKVLLYERGQFFRSHQDSERSDDMVATLIVLLPSQYTGGALKVRHKGATKSFRRTTRQDEELALLAFYGDCQHEISVVKSGHRVSVTFHLALRGVPSSSAPTLSKPSLSRLCELARQHFETPRGSSLRRSSTMPSRLVYLLDHEYSSRSLSWARLKGADRLVAQRAREVADALDAYCCLALAEVHEQWSCEPEDFDYGYHQWSHGRRALPQSPPDEHVLTDLIDGSVALHSWLDPDGNTVAPRGGNVSSAELSFNKTSDELTPFEVQHEGWQGNYGNTVDRWYHRGALVLWPKQNDFVLRAEDDHAWAIDRLLAMPESEHALLQQRAESLLRFWPSVSSRGERAEEQPFLEQLMALALRIDDQAVALELLSRVGAVGLETEALYPPLRALVDRHGRPWGAQLVTKWTGLSWRRTWCTRLDRLAAFMDAGDTPAKTLIRKLVADECAQWTKRVGRTHERWLDPKMYKAEASAFASLLVAATVLNQDAARNALLEDAAKASELAQLTAVEALLRHEQAHLTMTAFEESKLARQVSVAAQTWLARPERPSDRWDLDVARTCDGKDGEELLAFLRSDARHLEWPLNKQRRQNIHRTIDSRGLPVAHTTLRKGSPFKLQLVKKGNEIRKREAAHRRRLEAIVEALPALST